VIVILSYEGTRFPEPLRFDSRAADRSDDGGMVVLDGKSDRRVPYATSVAPTAGANYHTGVRNRSSLRR